MYIHVANEAKEKLCLHLTVKHIGPHLSRVGCVSSLKKKKICKYLTFFTPASFKSMFTTSPLSLLDYDRQRVVRPLSGLSEAHASLCERAMFCNTR